MTAGQARQKAKDVNTVAENSQFSKIIDKVRQAASKGDYYMYWYENLKPDVREKLVKSYGYTVGETTSDQRDGYTTKISW